MKGSTAACCCCCCCMASHMARCSLENDARRSFSVACWLFGCPAACGRRLFLALLRPLPGVPSDAPIVKRFSFMCSAAEGMSHAIVRIRRVVFIRKKVYYRMKYVRVP